MRTSGRVGRQGGTPMVDGAVERLTRWLRFDRGAYHSHVGLANRPWWPGR